MVSGSLANDIRTTQSFTWAETEPEPLKVRELLDAKATAVDVWVYGYQWRVDSYVVNREGPIHSAHFELRRPADG